MTTRRSLKGQAMPKPSLKTRRKRLKQVRKLNLRRISKKRRLKKRSLQSLRSRKIKSPNLKVTRSKDHQKPQSSAKSLQKETQKKKEDKQPVLEKPVKSLPKDGQNEQKTIADAKQEPSHSQRKPRRRSKLKNIRNNLSNNRAKQDINAPKPQEIANPSPAIYSEIRDLQKQINQEGPQVPNQVDETMHQRQPPPSNANTTNQPLVQAEGNNEQSETEKQEPVSQKQVSESGETGPLTTQ
ncbi:Hypothetical_protein [Hexamita inflata]|uniref:Hypothetical_protein n=1 Tax=Hexamita inflata TaxID=28002 RepID=A0AA86QTL5_9EUKA|nr:Hypothetical protein HINF_LOCUS46958 [Hexamita inflata]